MKRARGPLKFNWVDVATSSVVASGDSGNPGLILNQVRAGGTGPGRCVGRSYRVASLEVRLTMDFSVPGGRPARYMQSQTTYAGYTVPAASWAGGNGPALPIIDPGWVGGSGMVYPFVEEIQLSPERFIVAWDRQPAQSAAEATLFDILDYTTQPGLPNGLLAPFNEDNRDRFEVLYDRVFQGSIQKQYIEIKIGPDVFSRLPEVSMRDTSLGGPDNYANGVLYLFATSQANVTDPIGYNIIEQLISRVYYVDV